jgi:tetratricopeptide (TPR) repeat protein
MGCAYQNLRQNDLAILHFRQELKINPVSGEALYSLGTLYYNLHKYKQAVGYLERCYSLKHSVDQIVDRLAYSYFKTGQIEKEIGLYEGFLQEHPKDTWCLNNLGAALMHIGEYSRAQLYLRKAANINPKDQKVLRNIKKAQLNRRQMRLVT